MGSRTRLSSAVITCMTLPRQLTSGRLVPLTYVEKPEGLLREITESAVETAEEFHKSTKAGDVGSREGSQADWLQIPYPFHSF